MDATDQQSNTQPARIFISYKRNVDPDEPVATEVYKVLEKHHEVFIDKGMEIGELWGERIEQELRRSDYLITFLSAESVHSEMVLGEVELAHRLAKEQQGRPHILPVRLAFQEPFKYPLSAYLNPINWTFWKDDNDTPGLIAELERAISGQDLAITSEQAKEELLVPPPDLETPGGAMDPESPFYIERPGDKVAIRYIERQGVTMTIKGPRQVGKSSLLNRVMDAAIYAGKRIAFVDFQLFDHADFEDADIFYRQFCTWITEELDLDNRVKEFWSEDLGNIQNCTNYVKRYLLREVDGSLVLAIDKVERLFETDFRSDFFGMLRSWHNQRRARSPWKQLDLVLVSSTEPRHFIPDQTQSPFNVGEVIRFTDFTKDQVTILNQRHKDLSRSESKAPLTPDEEQQLMDLVGGHPYLVRRALYWVASGRITAPELFAHATDEHGPFGDHLRYYLFQLRNQKELVRGLNQVLGNNEKCQDEMVCDSLVGAGLVRSAGDKYEARCSLYRDYFKGRLRV